MTNGIDVMAEMIKAFRSSQGAGVNTRDILRSMLGELGYELPVTVSELQKIAEDLYLARLGLAAAEARAEAAIGVIPTGAAGLWSPGVPFEETSLGRAYLAQGWVTEGDVDSARLLVDELQGKLEAYAGAYFGDQGGEEIVTRILRPPTPTIEELPTAEEFSSSWRNAFAEFATGFTGTASAYLRGREGEIYQEYLADMMKFTKYGVSPFTLQEVQRLEQIQPPGEGAGAAGALAALKAARGEGVTEPTEVSGTAAEVAEQMSRMGQGIPREFIALPRIDPGTWLAGKYTKERVGLLEAAPSPEDVQRQQRVMGGMVGRPRRLRG